MEEKRELNLFEFIILMWKSTKRGFGNLGSFFKKIYILSLKYFWIVFPAVIILFIAGYFYSQPKNTIYKANGIITFAKEAKLMIINELNALNTLDRQQLAENLNISPNELSKFVRFKTFNVIDFLNDSIPDIVVSKNIDQQMTDTTNVVQSDMLGLQITMKGSMNYTPYIEGLTAYFNRVKPIVRVDSASKAMLRERINFCNVELERLDRFSEYDYFGGGRKTLKSDLGGITMEPSRKKLYYWDKRDLLKEKQYLITRAADRQNVINFTSNYMSITASRRIYKLAAFSFLGLCFGVIVANVIDRRKSSKKNKNN